MLLTRDHLPETISDIASLDDLLCRPSQALIDDLRKVDGDIMILGVAGKMGPTLAGLAKAAVPDRRIIGVARFSDAHVKDWLQARGIETINCDLLDETAIKALPKIPNIVFMAGRKFGAEGDLSLTWAMNAHVPALVAQAFAGSRIVAFSTGCVYPFVPVNGNGSGEDMAPNPPGEYAQSCVGRERMFEYFSRKFSTPGRLFRLNYAIDMRYGVLHDIASKVLAGKPIDVSLGHVNFIWQGDASAQALRCLAHCDTPTSPAPSWVNARWSVSAIAHLVFGGLAEARHRPRHPVGGPCHELRGIDDRWAKQLHCLRGVGEPGGRLLLAHDNRCLAE